MSEPRSPPRAVRPEVLPPQGDASSGRARTLPRTVAALATVLVTLVYLANPTAGIFELLPDNLPVVGNLDEAGATAALIAALAYLLRGSRREPRASRRAR